MCFSVLKNFYCYTNKVLFFSTCRVTVKVLAALQVGVDFLEWFKSQLVHQKTYCSIMISISTYFCLPINHIIYHFFRWSWGQTLLRSSWRKQQECFGQQWIDLCFVWLWFCHENAWSWIIEGSWRHYHWGNSMTYWVLQDSQFCSFPCKLS